MKALETILSDEEKAAQARRIKDEARNITIECYVGGWLEGGCDYRMREGFDFEKAFNKDGVPLGEALNAALADVLSAYGGVEAK